MFIRKPWTYGTDIVNRDYLNDGQTFNDLAQEINVAVRSANNMDQWFSMEPKNGNYECDPLLKRLQCKRPTWKIPLNIMLLDKFFNGQMGIRAQYYISPYHGQLMNKHLLNLLSEPLIESVEVVDSSIKEEFLRKSLFMRSAKVWVSEKKLNGDKIIRLSDLKLHEEEIQNDWLDVARRVDRGEFDDQYQLYCASINGVHAPIADQLEIKGAWLADDDWCEYVTQDKQDRDCQLFLFGFT